MNNKHIYVCFCQHTVATINIPFGARIANRTLLRKHFWCFFTFRTKNIHIFLVCFCQRTLATINVPFPGARITSRARFIESISGIFPHLERGIYSHLHNIPFKQELQVALDYTPKMSTVDLLRSTNCESLTHMASCG